MGKYTRTVLKFIFILTIIVLWLIYKQTTVFCDELTLEQTTTLHKALYDSLYAVVHQPDFLDYYSRSKINPNITSSRFYINEVLTGKIIKEFLSQIDWEEFLTQTEYDTISTKKDKLLDFFLDYLTKTQKQYQRNFFFDMMKDRYGYLISYLVNCRNFVGHNSNANIFITTPGFNYEAGKYRYHQAQEKELNRLGFFIFVEDNYIIISFVICGCKYPLKKIKLKP
jgi:hypothetical protein